MERRMYINDDWSFNKEWKEEFITGSGFETAEIVRLPHSAVITPYNYFDEAVYQFECAYKRILMIPAHWEGKNIFLTFEAVAHSSKVYINGILSGEHNCGYTAFTINISKFLKYGEENIIVVYADSRESTNVPPFGYVIDYMTYSGIYREAYIEVKEETYIGDVYINTKQQGENFILNINVSINGKDTEGCYVEYSAAPYIIEENKGMWRGYEKNYEGSLKRSNLSSLEESENNCIVRFEGSNLITSMAQWNIARPALYTLKVKLYDKEGKLLDTAYEKFGFREIRFTEKGFFLNGKRVKLRGLNRHQSYPYAGYAMPKSMQRLDADILKYELGVNSVRTSHYPQSKHFIDRCDELGILVFTEIPGWQHIGDEKWKTQALKNVEDMVLQYRNHPSIILWGVRINESVDDDVFYEKTNALARRLDPSRQTGGVRCIKNSHLLEDVYTFNDFSHTGDNEGLDKKSAVTKDKEHGYLVSEHNGHMNPTKVFDNEEQRLSQALRHANVLEAMYASKDIAGCFGWCMFDYNTHKDFGSGDRICYHGVMDMFRNPKLAAALYKSQHSKEAVLEISSTMDIGEHRAGNLGSVWVFTNADYIKLYKNGEFVREFYPNTKKYKHLLHPPIEIDDFIGCLLEKNEDMDKKTADDVREILIAIAKYGQNHMPPKTMLKAAKLLAAKKFSFDDGYKLYGKYIGNWGGELTGYKIEAVKGGRIVKVIERTPVLKPKLIVKCDHNILKEKYTYDVALIRIEAADENGQHLPYFNEPLMLETEGAIEIIGPKMISLKGGFGGTYIKTLRTAGKAKLIIKSEQCETVIEEFIVEI